MSTVAPPPPPPPPSAAPAPPSLTATVQSPPDALAKLPVGAKLDALVLAQVSGGKVQVQTSAGPVTLETPLPLGKDSTLSLQVVSRAPVLKLQIVSIDGALAQNAAKAAGQAGAATAGLTSTLLAATKPGPQAATVTGPQVSLSTGSPVIATLLTPGRFVPAPGTINPQQTMAATQGSPTGQTAAQGLASSVVQNLRHVGSHVRSFQLYQGGGTPQAGQSSAQTASGNPRLGPGHQLAGPQGPQSVGNAVAAGASVRITVVSITPPQGGTPGAQQPPQAGTQPLSTGLTLTGTITGTTTGGQAVVQTPAGAIALPGANPPPLGSSVTLQVLAPPQPPGTEANLDPAQIGRTLLKAPSWPAISDAMTDLERTNPTLAGQVSTTILPNISNSNGLAAGLLMFLGALKAGDARAALGDAALRALDRARPGAAGRLDGDMKGLAKAGDDAAQAGDWRAAVVPTVQGHEIQPIRILTRRERNSEDTGDDPEGGNAINRFVVDVTLSQLGRIQLDGNVFGEGKRMDLTIRSERRLPTTMQNDIRSLFANAGSLTGVTGGLSFLADPRTFIEIQDQTDDHGGHFEITV